VVVLDWPLAALGSLNCPVLLHRIAYVWTQNNLKFTDVGFTSTYFHTSSGLSDLRSLVGRPASYTPNIFSLDEVDSSGFHVQVVAQTTIVCSRSISPLHTTKILNVWQVFGNKVGALLLNRWCVYMLGATESYVPEVRGFIYFVIT